MDEAHVPGVGDRGRRRWKQIPVWWRTALNSLWLVLVAVAFIVGIPALAVIAAVMFTVQLAYFLYVAIRYDRPERVPDAQRQPPSRRQVEVAFWIRVALLLYWIGMIPVMFAIHVPVAALPLLAIAGIQAAWIVYLGRMRRRVG